MQMLAFFVPCCEKEINKQNKKQKQKQTNKQTYLY